ncbi:MAG TPA: ATP-binding protein [Bryobacteraceae bacterium]|nr:ATP-binding protein [Bryobacteraceae bacterium]
MRLSLATKLTLSLFGGAVLIFAVFGYLDLRMQRRHLEETILEAADRVSDLIQRSTRYQMLHNDREAMFQAIRDMGSEPGIRRIRIFNKEGRISFSTVPRETGAVVDKQAEACYGCHRRGAPLVRLERPDRARIFVENGERVLAVIRPIENQPSCWQSDCHFHSSDQQVLGVIDAHLTLAKVDARQAAQRSQAIRVTALALGLLCGASMLFVWRLVYRPLHDLRGGMRRIARGDLGYRVAVRSRDELGEVAEAFNHMAGDLAAAREELTAWARTLEQRVEQKAIELERANKLMATSERMASLGRLAATVAHEVNNPLFGILNYARLTRKDVERADPPPATRERMLEQLQIIERESRRCGELMRNLLMFARQSPRRIESADLNETIGRAIALVRHRYELSGIALEEQLAPDLPRVPCDANQVQQVVLGLLVNAAEAMPRGGRVQIASALDDHAGFAVIRVRDDGPGIPADVLPQVFEPFFTTKEDEHRTGLGLAVARSIVEQHGGVITVQSAEGAGAEFAIRLPLATAAREPEPAPSGAAGVTS